MKISRQAYADMFGPTVGDKVRLADTELWIEVEQDFTTYGEEVKFGGGKVIRDGQGQSQFLAVRRNAGMDLLVQRFGAELKRFKREPAYAELSARYGAAPAMAAPLGNATASGKTVEQQESSAQ